MPGKGFGVAAAFRLRIAPQHPAFSPYPPPKTAATPQRPCGARAPAWRGKGSGVAGPRGAWRAAPAAAATSNSMRGKGCGRTLRRGGRVPPPRARLSPHPTAAAPDPAAKTRAQGTRPGRRMGGGHPGPAIAPQRTRAAPSRSLRAPRDPAPPAAVAPRPPFWWSQRLLSGRVLNAYKRPGCMLSS